MTTSDVSSHAMPSRRKMLRIFLTNDADFKRRMKEKVFAASSCLPPENKHTSPA